MLSSLVKIPEVSDPSPEDVFASSFDVIFPDETRHVHGDAGSHVIYKSRRFGDIHLRLPDPESEGDRRLFAHYLWNAGVLLAEFVSGLVEPRLISGGISSDVEGHNVLELGAGALNVAFEILERIEAYEGTGVCGIVAALAGAEEVVISDYPAAEILACLRINAKKNVPPEKCEHITVQGHEWGVMTDEFSKANEKCFSRVLCADCLWLTGEHLNLVRSMLHFLREEVDARIWIIAGFHTGRAALASFFDTAVGAGLNIVSIWERDVNGNERQWVRAMDDGKENVSERKKWLVVAILKRHGN